MCVRANIDKPKTTQQSSQSELIILSAKQNTTRITMTRTAVVIFQLFHTIGSLVFSRYIVTVIIAYHVKLAALTQIHCDCQPCQSPPDRVWVDGVPVEAWTREIEKHTKQVVSSHPLRTKLLGRRQDLERTTRFIILRTVFPKLGKCYLGEK